MYKVELYLYHTDSDIAQNQAHFPIEVSMNFLPKKNEKFKFDEKWLDQYDENVAIKFEHFFNDKSPEFITINIKDYKNAPSTFDYTVYAVEQLIENKSAFFDPKEKPLDD